MVETKTLFLAGMPGYVHLNRPCYLRNASKTLGSPAIVNPTEVLSAVFQEQEKPHHLSSSFPDPLRCCSCLGQVLELEMLVSSPQFLRKKKKRKKGCILLEAIKIPMHLWERMKASCLYHTNMMAKRCCLG